LPPQDALVEHAPHDGFAARRRRAPASQQFFVNAPNNRVVVGREATLDAFVRSGIVDFTQFDRTIERVHADSGFVFIMGLETVTPKNDAPAAGLMAGRTIQRRFSNVWKNEQGVWRLFARHANVISR
jgi:hypothetical protein